MAVSRSQKCKAKQKMHDWAKELQRYVWKHQNVEFHLTAAVDNQTAVYQAHHSREYQGH